MTTTNNNIYEPSQMARRISDCAYEMALEKLLEREFYIKIKVAKK